MQGQTPDQTAAAQVLQSLVWPDALHPDPAFTFRLQGAVVAGESLRFDPGDRADLNTEYNAFPLAKWQRVCGLSALRLAIRAKGRFTLTVTAGETQTRFAVSGSTDIDLTPLISTASPLLFLSFQAETAGEITGLDWITLTPPPRLPRLMLVITTFRREAAATATAQRFDHFMADSPLAAHLHLTLVDNGQSLTLPASPHVTLIANRNLGGSGGFARGLAHAVDQGFTHCLFMDDDAAIDMASLARTWAFLAHATDPAIAVAGGLMRADQPTRLWESLACFDGFCRPLNQDRDLTQPQDLLAIESLAPPGPVYGGFWFFAFAVQAVQHWPFPFFIRGDDVSFSLTNPFRITNLTGVISFQALDFPDKESALTLYLGLRCDLINTLILPGAGVLRALSIPALSFFRAMVLLRPDSMAALNLALKDILTGPTFFADNADLAQRRAQIAAQRQREVWRPLIGPAPLPRQRLNPQSVLTRALMLITLNGMLLPFFGRWGNHLVLRQGTRLRVGQAWGAARITVISSDGTQAMTLIHDKAAILKQGLSLLKNLCRLGAGHRSRRKIWAEGYARLTSRAFWQGQF